jgi:hypothetical protein
MGQAKRRGTFEDRAREAREVQRTIAEERRQRIARFEVARDAVQPGQRRVIDRAGVPWLVCRCDAHSLARPLPILGGSPCQLCRRKPMPGALLAIGAVMAIAALQ